MSKMIKISIFIVIVIAIAIAGFFLWPKTMNDVPTDGDNTTGEIDTSDWQTYTNEEYGFEVKIPESWIAESRENLVTFKDEAKIAYYEGSEIYLISVSVRGFDSNNEMEEYIGNWKNTKIERGGWIKNVEIANAPVVQGFDYLGSYTINFIDDKSYYFITKVNLPDYPLLDEIYNKFLNSFKINDLQ